MIVAVLSCIVAVAASLAQSDDRLALLAVKAQLEGRDASRTCISTTWVDRGPSSPWCNGTQPQQQGIPVGYAAVPGAYTGVICDATGTFVVALHLRQCGFAGTVPDLILPRLRLLDLAYNPELSGPVPPWQQLPCLERLYLAHLKLRCPLPPEWALLAPLQVIDVPAAGVTGTLPVEWSALGWLQNVSLLQNALVGPLPPAWGNLTALHGLHLSDNALAGLCRQSGPTSVACVSCLSSTTTFLVPFRRNGAISRT